MTLGLVFGAVLFAGAASGAWGEPEGSTRAPSSSEALPPGADLTGADLSPQQARQLVGDSGDRWAAYLSPQQYADLTGGRYAGVGLSVDREAGGPTLVAEVLPGSPAARAGIEAGDRLVTVDGTPAEQLPVTELVSRLRGGPAGSAVAVGVAQRLPEGGGVDLHVVLLTVGPRGPTSLVLAVWPRRRRGW